jgi:dolichyl-phosphate-mannose--protein O-mannosyl transferase
MEPHPPLGKLLIAFSEKIINPNKNIDKSNFLTSDHIKDIPEGYNFTGVRFISTLSCIYFSITIFFNFITII